MQREMLTTRKFIPYLAASAAVMSINAFAEAHRRLAYFGTINPEDAGTISKAKTFVNGVDGYVDEMLKAAPTTQDGRSRFEEGPIKQMAFLSAGDFFTMQKGARRTRPNDQTCDALIRHLMTAKAFGHKTADWLYDAACSFATEFSASDTMKEALRAGVVTNGITSQVAKVEALTGRELAIEEGDIVGSNAGVTPATLDYESALQVLRHGVSGTTATIVGWRILTTGSSEQFDTAFKKMAKAA